jgi:putative transposase
LFHKDGDFEAFQRVLGEGLARYPVELLTYCLMENHWHLVLRPREKQALARLMGWVGVTHVRRHHEHYCTRGGGHLYQGRFKSFPVQEDRHLLVLCRYVEANAVRAGMVKDVRDWPWCGVRTREHANRWLKLSPWPVDRPRNWLSLLNDPMDRADLTSVRNSVQRGRPLGTAAWVARTAQRLGLNFTLRNPGRPRKQKSQRSDNQ